MEGGWSVLCVCVRGGGVGGRGGVGGGWSVLFVCLGGREVCRVVSPLRTNL